MATWYSSKFVYSVSQEILNTFNFSVYRLSTKQIKEMTLDLITRRDSKASNLEF